MRPANAASFKRDRGMENGKSNAATVTCPSDLAIQQDLGWSNRVGSASSHRWDWAAVPAARSVHMARSNTTDHRCEPLQSR